MMGPYNFETNVFGNFNHEKNDTRLCIENYFPEKNHWALPKQLTNILITFCTFKIFKPVKVKLVVVNKYRACQSNLYCNHKITQSCQNNLQAFL